MVSSPTVHAASATVAELREFFRDDHVHLALLVDEGTLIAAVDRQDLNEELNGQRQARSLGRLRGRTIRPDALLSDAKRTMKRQNLRRLAVTDARGVLLGLLCLKSSGLGFCSDDSIGSRKPRQAS
jgi:predicted transcriptional regulator